jgi:shikimate kinase/3-dehydroquinate synthase
MRFDKKNRDGGLTFVLLRGIGQAFTMGGVPVDDVAETLRDGGAR